MEINSKHKEFLADKLLELSKELAELKAFMHYNHRKLYNYSKKKFCTKHRTSLWRCTAFKIIKTYITFLVDSNLELCRFNHFSNLKELNLCSVSQFPAHKS